MEETGIQEKCFSKTEKSKAVVAALLQTEAVLKSLVLLLLEEFKKGRGGDKECGEGVKHNLRSPRERG